jgi:hypothetical protein
MAREAGVSHVILVLIVGLEGVGYSNYEAKLAAEAIVDEDIAPGRSCERHNSTPQLRPSLRPSPGRPSLPAVLDKWRFQPVDLGDAASRLVEAVAEKPAGQLRVGCPEPRNFKSIAQSWLKARKLNKRPIPLPLRFKFSRQFASGCLLAPDHKRGKITFEQYLEEM